VKSLRIFLLVLCASTLSFAVDNEFRGVVRAIEGRYGVHHTHIPMLGFAMFFAHPSAGVSGLKLAVFEDFHATATLAEVTSLVESSLGRGWYPFVRVRSNDDNETTLIYASPDEGKMRMMIVNLESSEATVVELKLNDRAIKQWLKEPGEEAEGQSGHHHHPEVD
jgi:hypothetical protein